MSSYVDMSLEDIINIMKRENARAKRSKVNAKPFKPPKKAPITDARNKIISKNRFQITNTREKLAQLAKQRDARFRFEKLRQERARVPGPGPVRNTFPNRGIFAKAPPIKERVFTDSSRQVIIQPLTTPKIGMECQMNTHTFTVVKSIEKPRLFEFQDKPESKPLLRTVEYSPQTFNGVANLQLKITTQNNDFVEKKNREYLKLWASCWNEEWFIRTRQKLLDTLEKMLKKIKTINS